MGSNGRIMNWIRILVCGMVLLLAGLPVGDAGAAMRAASGSLNAQVVMARLQRHYQSTKAFSARFEQTIERVGAPPLRRSGQIHFEKPGKLRWEFETPQAETIVSNGKTIYDYDPGLNQVVETPLRQAFKSQAATAFLLGAGNLERDFIAAPVRGIGADGLIHLALTPKTGGNRIDVGIDRTTYNIQTMTIVDSLGNRTELHFSDIEVNQPLAASLFQFSPPAGADIVGSQGIQ